MEQPEVSDAVKAGFLAKNKTILSQLQPQASGDSTQKTPLADIFNVLNPTGQAWLLLAFPDGTDAEALSMFSADTEDQQAGDAGVHRIALAGPAYEGVAVLAHGLLGSARSLDSIGAPSSETIFWRERSAGVDARKWSVGCFRDRDQLMPMFLIHINEALHSDMQGEVNRLKRHNSVMTYNLGARYRLGSLIGRGRLSGVKNAARNSKSRML